MELRQLWKIARRRWWLILLPPLVAVALVAPALVGSAPAGGFSTGMRFTAAAPPEDDAPTYEDAEYYPWLASEYVVNALTDWVRTGSFAAEVSTVLADQHEIELAPAAIQGSIAADNERSVLLLNMSGGDADTLAAMASAATTVLETRAIDYFPQFGEDGIEVVALDEPVIAAVPPSLSARLEPLLRVALGAAVGVALAFLIEYLDPTVRERREVEALGIPVLAEVPRRG